MIRCIGRGSGLTLSPALENIADAEAEAEAESPVADAVGDGAECERVRLGSSPNASRGFFRPQHESLSLCVVQSMSGLCF